MNLDTTFTDVSLKLVNQPINKYTNDLRSQAHWKQLLMSNPHDPLTTQKPLIRILRACGCIDPRVVWSSGPSITTQRTLKACVTPSCGFGPWAMTLYIIQFFSLDYS